VKFRLCLWIALLLVGTTAAKAQEQDPDVQQIDYEEVRIGEWVLRSDRYLLLYQASRPGTLEMVARSTDGRAEFILLDNGAILSAELAIPGRCYVYAHHNNYPSPSDVPNPITHTVANMLRTDCGQGGYRSEIEAWLRDLPSAIEAMKARALSLFGEPIQRCVQPPRPRTSPPPFEIHPYCGFPPDRVDEAQGIRMPMPSDETSVASQDSSRGSDPR
jgi:hypothetical protein